MIATEGLQPGDRVPSERALARELRAAPMTIRRALAVLRDEGLIERQPARGTFVARALSTPVDDVFQTPPALHTLPPKGARTITIETQDSLPHQMAFWREALRRFETSHPGVTVRQISASADPTPHTRGLVGDVVFLPQFSVPRFQAAGCIRPLAQPAAAEDFLPCFGETASLGVPFSSTATLFLFNTDLSARLGLDLEDLTFTGLVERLLDAGDALANTCLLAVTVLFPASVVARDEVNTEAGRTSLPEQLAPFLRDLVQLGDRIRATMSDRHVRFRQGEIAVMETTTAVAPYACSGDTPHLLRLPPAYGRARLRHSPCVLAVSPYAEHPDLAEELAHFLASPAIQRLVVAHAYGIPARAGLLAEADPATFPGLDAVRAFARRGRAYSATQSRAQEFCSTICMPLCAAMLEKRIPIDEGLERMRQWTERFHAGAVGWGRPVPAHLELPERRATT